MRPFDAILIDFYGTISAGDREAVDHACRTIVGSLELPTTAATFAVQWGERFFATIERSNHEAFQTLYECELQSLREILREFGRDADPRPFVAPLEAYWADPPLHPDAVGFLMHVDVPICCVSNADTRPLLQAISKHGLLFDAVLSSEQARCYKPDAEIFRQALEVLGVDPKRVMHVGDSLHSDIGGASKLGITSTWVRRDDRIHDIGACEPTHTVNNLDEARSLCGLPSVECS